MATRQFNHPSATRCHRTGDLFLLLLILVLVLLFALFLDFWAPSSVVSLFATHEAPPAFTRGDADIAEPLSFRSRIGSAACLMQPARAPVAQQHLVAGQTVVAVANGTTLPGDADIAEPLSFRSRIGSAACLMQPARAPVAQQHLVAGQTVVAVANGTTLPVAFVGLAHVRVVSFARTATGGRAVLVRAFCGNLLTL